MAFVFKNPHPEGLRVGDCTKRAMVIATSINYPFNHLKDEDETIESLEYCTKGE